MRWWKIFSILGVLLLCTGTARASEGWNVGDTAPNFVAPDQAGAPVALTDFRGQWVFLDFCAAWCWPCRYMAEGTQATWTAWENHPTVSFEYVTALIQGPGYGASTQADAEAWSSTYGITRPVLHSDGSVGSPITSWFGSLGTGLVPTGVFVDPAGVIRAVVVGYESPADLTDRLRDLAGIVDPPPPPQPPLPGHLTGGSYSFLAAGMVDFSPLSFVNDPVYGENWLVFQDFDANQNGALFQGQVQSRVAPGSLEEALDAALVDGTLAGLPLGQPCSATLLGATWLDGQPREFVPGRDSATVSFVVESGGDFVEVPTSRRVPVTLTGNTISWGSFLPASIPGAPATAIGFVLRGLRVRPRFDPAVLAVPGAARAAAVRLAAPAPNPARGAQRFEFSLASPARARLDVLDVQGRLVRTLADADLPAGVHTRTWDLADASGHRLAPGVYLARAQAGGATSVRRVVIVDR